MTQITEVTSRWTVVEKVLGVVTALLALATGFFAYKTATITQAKEQAQAIAADKNAGLSSLQSQYEALKSQDESTQAENARLRAQLGLGLSTSNTQASVIRTGSIKLVDEQVYDIDNDVINGSGSEMYFPQAGSEFLIGPANSGVFATLSGQPTAQNCKSALEHEHTTSLNLTKKPIGYVFCLLTSDKHVAVMILAHKSSLTEEHSISFDYVVYR
jgi:hypothetical protein